MKCHDPDYIWKPYDTKHKCLISSFKKSKFTCKNCPNHMWICSDHKDDNRQELNKFKESFLKDHKLNFGLLVVSAQTTPNSQKRRNPTTPTKFTPNKKYKVKQNASVEVVDDSPPKRALDNSKKTDMSNTSVEKVAGKSKKKKALDQSNKANQKNSRSPKNDGKTSKKKEPSPGLSCEGHGSISTTEATKKLRKELASIGEKVELRPIPKGKAQFMIGQTKGKSRPLNILYDSGCYALLMKEGVQNELGKAVLKTKGPFVVNGVGNTSVKVNDEWQTSLSLVDGARQAVEGWTVDEVTAALPKIDLTKAVEEIKSDNKKNANLQSMFVQLVTGGDCDILLGQMYNAIFPIPVHSLPSGLTIYELQVTPHDPNVNSVLSDWVGHMRVLSLWQSRLVVQLFSSIS